MKVRYTIEETKDGETRIVSDYEMKVNHLDDLINKLTAFKLQHFLQSNRNNPGCDGEWLEEDDDGFFVEAEYYDGRVFKMKVCKGEADK